MYGVKRASGNGRTTLSRRAPFKGLGDTTGGSCPSVQQWLGITDPNDPCQTNFEAGALESLPISSVPINAASNPTASSLTLAAAPTLQMTTLAYWGLAAAGAVLVLGAIGGGRR